MRSSRNCPEGADMPGVLLLLMLCATTWAADFAGGTGGPDDPYQIATAAQLISIGSDPNLQDRHFVLVGDIDMDPNVLDDEMSMSGLVLSTGSLDGDGHSILNLRLNSGRRGNGAPALFESIGPNAIVRDLSLEGAHTDTDSDLSRAGMLGLKNEGFLLNCRAEGALSANAGGGLVAENLGLILNCSVAGSTSGRNLGGLVGTNSGTIMYCFSTASATGGSGLVRENSGTIVACFATGNVTDGSAGLVGDNYGTIRYCYATGDVWAVGDLAGGLVATNSGEISYCYATGNVWAEEKAAGLVASNEGTITHCYATGSGGMALVADGYGDGTILGCYALSVRDGGGINDGIGIALTDAQMRRQECFVGWDFTGTPLDGELDHWTMAEDGGYPALTAIKASGCPGSGTTDDPYLVETHHLFMAISHEPQACYRLVADIDLQGQTFWKTVMPVFWGHLDGAGHSVSNFTLTGGRNVGLLGMVYSEANVTDLHLHNVYVETTGAQQRGIAALAACNRGTVMDCSAAAEMRVLGDGSTYYVAGLVGVNEGGDITRCSARLSLVYQHVGSRGPRYYCAGLVGHNAGTISQCHASAYTNSKISGFAGLVGQNDGSITDCYANGHFSGYLAGGLVELNSGSIMNCYAATIVSNSESGAGLVAENPEGIISSSYFLAETDSGGPDNGFGTELSDAMMRQQASFGGWDFETVWMICEGLDYPRLRWEEVQCQE